MLTSTEGGTVQGLNLAKPLLLPAVAPAQELSAFRALLVELKAFFEAHPIARCDIQLCNGRDRNRRGYGTLGCRICKTDHAHEDETAAAAIRARVDADQELMHWLKQVALQTVSLWSSTVIREKGPFGLFGGPYAHLVRSRQVVPVFAFASLARQSRADPRPPSC